MGMDGEEKLGRHLSFLDSENTEKKEEEEEGEEDEEGEEEEICWAYLKSLVRGMKWAN
jgi:hypothetical protein